jgi:hypothetical protein
VNLFKFILEKNPFKAFGLSFLQLLTRLSEAKSYFQYFIRRKKERERKGLRERETIYRGHLKGAS